MVSCSEETEMNCDLERRWVEIFRAGNYGEKGNWTYAELDRIASDYDPAKHAAPVVIGHPADDAPAWGWVKRLRRAGESLWAQLTKVAPEFEELVRQGRFLQRSVSLYKNFLPTGGPYLRHLGFLGASPPAVKGMKPLFSFADGALGVVDFSDTPRSKQATREVACTRFSHSPGWRIVGVEKADDATLLSEVERISYGDALRILRDRARG